MRRMIKFLSSQLGFDIFRFGNALFALPAFFFDLYQFKKKYENKIIIKPCLHDKNEEGGVSRGEYFLQDLYVARKIYQKKPEKHVDIGSRLDGFVTHVASYREIEVIDIRPINSNIPGIKFHQMDMMSVENDLQSYCDSISCLHTLEHFGLGRYGDPLDVEGHIKGLKNIAKLLKKSGFLYLSVPIGVERIEFNANRVFCPEKLIGWAENFDLKLHSLSWISLSGSEMIEVEDVKSELLGLKAMQYALGIFIFEKKS